MGRAVALGLAWFALLWIAGCGGGSHKSSGSSGAPAASAVTKRDYVARANAICGALNGQTHALERRYLSGAKAQSPRSAATFASNEAPPVRAALVRLTALKAPPGDEARVNAFLGEVRKGLAALERAAGNGKAAQRMLRRGGPFTKAQQLALSYGLSLCAQRG